MKKYLVGVWDARYFWFHLALSDLRSRWRRSFLGMLWSILQPLGMTLLIAFVLGRVFHVPMKEYAPFILSGTIIWEYILTCAMSGATGFIQADAYIKQFNHPLAIYTLRFVVANLVVFALASLSLIGWVLIVLPSNLNCTWFLSLIIFPVLLLISWPLATIFAYIGTRFRDFPYMLGILFQALWFMSPVYFQPKLFQDGNMSYLLDYNPLYHLMQIVRAPLLSGVAPTLDNFLYSLLTAFFLYLIAIGIGSFFERKVIFYL